MKKNKKRTNKTKKNLASVSWVRARWCHFQNGSKFMRFLDWLGRWCKRSAANIFCSTCPNMHQFFWCFFFHTKNVFHFYTPKNRASISNCVIYAISIKKECWKMRARQHYTNICLYVTERQTHYYLSIGRNRQNKRNIKQVSNCVCFFLFFCRATKGRFSIIFKLVWMRFGVCCVVVCFEQRYGPIKKSYLIDLLTQREDFNSKIIWPPKMNRNTHALHIEWRANQKYIVDLFCET